jgi:hypothetical protein
MVLMLARISMSSSSPSNRKIWAPMKKKIPVSKPTITPAPPISATTGSFAFMRSLPVIPANRMKRMKMGVVKYVERKERIVAATIEYWT